VSDFLPHVREPSSGEPDVCVHCREEWVDLLTLYERDECSVRLRAEVERLRGEVSYLRACVPPTRPTDYGHEVWTAALRAEVAAERTAVVTWIRRVATDARDWSEHADVYDAIADNIESGEHRRGETK
jgi:hypothetical protein